MERDWQKILDDYEAFNDDGLVNWLYDDDGVFEALWNYVVNGSQEDEGLRGIVWWEVALQMLLSIGMSEDELCQALVMNKESFAESLSAYIDENVDEIDRMTWKDDLKGVMEHMSVRSLSYTFDGPPLKHETAVTTMITRLADKSKLMECWGPLRLLHSVLARAIRGNVDPLLLQRGCKIALETIDSLSLWKQGDGSDEKMTQQLRRERDRWYSFLDEVSAYTERDAPGNTGRDPVPGTDPSLLCFE